LSILAFKAAHALKQAIAVPPAYRSPACSGCGVIVSKGLSVRWHVCPDEECGTSLHRDHHAAVNILALGKAEQSRSKVRSGRPLRRERGPLGRALPEASPTCMRGECQSLSRLLGHSSVKITEIYLEDFNSRQARLHHTKFSAVNDRKVRKSDRGSHSYRNYRQPSGQEDVNDAVN
jgi:hypothetical protein